jgi:hypothetical protein
MPNDMIRLAMERAVKRFGGNDRIFNAANFSATFTELADVRGSLDGKVVRAMLAGRTDVKPLLGGAHFKLIVRAR